MASVPLYAIINHGQLTSPFGWIQFLTAMERKKKKSRKNKGIQFSKDLIQVASFRKPRKKWEHMPRKTHTGMILIYRLILLVLSQLRRYGTLREMEYPSETYRAEVCFFAESARPVTKRKPGLAIP